MCIRFNTKEISIKILLRRIFAILVNSQVPKISYSQVFYTKQFCCSKNKQYVLTSITDFKLYFIHFFKYLYFYQICYEIEGVIIYYKVVNEDRVDNRKQVPLSTVSVYNIQSLFVCNTWLHLSQLIICIYLQCMQFQTNFVKVFF